MESNVPVGGYMWRFAIAYLAAMAGAMALGALLEAASIPVPSSAFAVATAIAAAAFVGERFLKDHGRAPNSSERRRLSLFSLGVSTLMSTVLVVGLLAVLTGGDLQSLLTTVRSELQISDQTLLLIAAGATLFALLIQYFVFSLSYGWMLRRRASGLAKNEKPAA
jgi:hypothetical protein